MTTGKMKKAIFLTGGSGFIGRNIWEHFSEKYHIFAPGHGDLDLTDEKRVAEFFDSHKIDVVIHSAVRPGNRNAKDPSNQLYCNTRMFFNIVRNSERFEKMIFLSSGLVYDIRHYQPKMREEYFDVHVPVDEGGFSKYIAAKYIERSDNIVELRPFGVFGKYEDYSIRFISNLICKAIFDLPLTMRQNRRFDYISVDDFMPILDYFIHNNGRHKSYNVTPDESVELLMLAEKIRRISDKDLPIVVAQGGMGTEYSGDNTRLREEIRRLSFTPLDEVIRKLYAWYTEKRHGLNRDLLLVDR